MKIKLINTKLAYSERTLICVPCSKFRSTDHPIREIRVMFPFAYRHFREHCEDERRAHDSKVLLGRGKFLLSDFDDQKICWMTVHNRHENYFQIEWIAEVVQSIAEAGLHLEYDMAFPALGFYADDGVDQEKVLKMVYNAFSDSKKQLDYHILY